jgi:AcrR family transcriptional regulator
VTKARIIDAALETIKREGIVGSSARAIARTGGFNQALIFYHFGSVDEVLLAAVDKLSATRMASYEQHLAGVRSLPELVAVGARLYAEDLRDGHITVLAQMLAGSSSSPELSRQLRERFTPWIDLASGAIARAVAGTPFEQVLPVDDLAFAVTSLFMGIELLDHLDDDRARGQAVFGTVELVARLMESFAGPSAPAGDRQTGPA